MNTRLAANAPMQCATVSSLWPQAASAANAANAAGVIGGRAHTHHTSSRLTSPCRTGCIHDLEDCQRRGCRWYRESFGRDGMSAAPEPTVVARIVAAGGIASCGAGYRPGTTTLYLEATLPHGADHQLVADLEAQGWLVTIAPSARVLR
jgi:hypothetical protein